MQFDARAAKALTPGTHLTIGGCPGLRLDASRSRRSWTYRFKSPVDGRMRQVAMGQWPALSAIAAAGEWETLRAQRDAGRDPALERKAARGAPPETKKRTPETYTVRWLCDDYLAQYSGTVTEKTYNELERLFGTELGGVADELVAKVTRAMAFDLLQPMRSRPVIARRLRQGLGAAWDHALDAGRVPPESPNWWRLVLRGKLPSLGRTIGGEQEGVTKRSLSAAEVGAVLRFLPNFSRDIEDTLELYLWTCCRGSEIVAMERDEIAREADGVWWTVPKAKLKMRRNPLTVDLRVPLVGRALEVVERRLAAASGNFLFPSPRESTSGGHIQQKAAGVAVWSHMPYAETRPDWVRPRLTVGRWAPHDLRRTGRTMLSALGCPSEIAEAILGHMPPGIQGVYDRYGYDQERRAWLTKLSKRLEALSKR